MKTVWNDGDKDNIGLYKFTTKNIKPRANDIWDISHRIASQRIASHRIAWHGLAWHGIVSYRITYHIISYHIISYHIISYHIISYHIISYHIISYHIIHIISCIISHHISYPILSYPIISCDAIYHIVSYRIIPHHVIYSILTYDGYYIIYYVPSSWSSEYGLRDYDLRSLWTLIARSMAARLCSSHHPVGLGTYKASGASLTVAVLNTFQQT